MAGPMETVRCVNSGCRAEIPNDVSFCPLCGTDQRPPNSRAAVLCPQHQTIGNGRFCTRCGAPMNAQPAAAPHAQPNLHAMPGVTPVAMEEPTDLWAWMMALTPVIASPLVLTENGPVIIIGAVLLNALFCFLDWRDTEQSGYEGIPFIAGFILPPVYLILRALKRRDQGAYAAISLAALCLLTTYFVAEVQHMQQIEEAQQELDRSMQELDSLPDFGSE